MKLGKRIKFANGTHWIKNRLAYYIIHEKYSLHSLRELFSTFIWTTARSILCPAIPWEPINIFPSMQLIPAEINIFFICTEFQQLTINIFVSKHHSTRINIKSFPLCVKLTTATRCYCMIVPRTISSICSEYCRDGGNELLLPTSISMCLEWYVAGEGTYNCHYTKYFNITCYQSVNVVITDVGL